MRALPIPQLHAAFLAGIIAAFTSPVHAQPAPYTLGGVSCAAAPANFGFYCFDGVGFVRYREALANPDNFGPGGTVPVPVTTVAVSGFTAAELAGVDGLVVPWWSTADAGANAELVRQFFLAGGDLFVLADNVGNDPVNAALGVPTRLPTVAAGATTGTAPLYGGPFGAAASVLQFLNAGRLDPAEIIFHNGRVVGTNSRGEPVAAVWAENQYAPGAGRLVIATDIDMLTAFGPVIYEPLAARTDNGRFGLNATAFLVSGGTIDEITFDLIGVPSCAISPGGFGFYCGTTGVLWPLRLAAGDPANFGPGAPGQRRVAFTEFGALTPGLMARLRAVIVPWIADADAAPYAEALRTYFRGGGNLWVLQDDPAHDPIGELLGIPTATATVGFRLTNGTAPVYDGPFGLATDVAQSINFGGLDAGAVAIRGGTVVGTDAASGDNVVAAWDRGAYSGGAGRMVIATDVDSVFLPNFGPANTRWALNTIAFLVTGGRYDGVAPSLTCSATPNVLWPVSGKTVPVTVSGTVTDPDSGVDPAGLTFSVIDEYGQVQPSGSVALTGNGSFSVGVPLVARRAGSDRDGRTYTIAVTARDRAGNAASCTTVVTVPHDQRR